MGFSVQWRTLFLNCNLTLSDHLFYRMGSRWRLARRGRWRRNHSRRGRSRWRWSGRRSRRRVIDGRVTEPSDGLDLGEEYRNPRWGEGEDDADIYREFKWVGTIGSAEEAISWQEYLDKYPNPSSNRLLEKSASLSSRQDSTMNALKIVTKWRWDGTAEIKLTQPVFLSNIDPRQKFHAGFEMGFPAQFNIILD